MSRVKEKLLKALDELRGEGRKISPFAVEKRAGVANGSSKYHPDVLEVILAEKAKTTLSSESKAPKNALKSKQEKAQLTKAKEQIEKLKSDNAAQKIELEASTNAIAQLTWELHRYKTKTNQDHVIPLKS